MYLTAASAAWRYSGNVTGPDSMLSRPKTSGSPEAFFGVPRAAPASGVAADAVVLDDDDDDEEDDDDLSFPPHPATSRPVAARATKLPIQLLLTRMVLLIGVMSVRRSPRPRLRPGSWNAADPGGRADRRRPPGGRAVRGSGRRRGRRPRVRARRAARRTGRRRRCPRRRAAGWAGAARRSPAPARGSSRRRAGPAARRRAPVRPPASAARRPTGRRPCDRGTSRAQAAARAAARA